MSNPFVESTFCRQDSDYEVPLRPKALHDFVGQEQVREQLDVFIGAAKKRNEALGHCLFSGPPGLGKTTLSHIIANAMGSNIVVTSGPVIEKAGDLAGILANLKKGDILFIDEIHRLNRTVEEYLYPAMEDFQLDLVIESGTQARSVKVKLNPFTLVGATTRLGLLSSPLRSRFAFTCRLDYYSADVIEQILNRSCSILQVGAKQVEAKNEGLREIAKRSRGTPRVANNLLRWVRDYAQMRADNLFSKEVAQRALHLIAIDEKGLDDMDLRILRVLVHQYKGLPVGLQTLAMAVGEEPHTIEEVHEPYLVMQGFLQKTPRGRLATELAFGHLGVEYLEIGREKL